MNVDQLELRKFGDLAARWWDPAGPMRTLHDINPVRLAWIGRIAPLAGRSVLDVGCGGGVLAESMAAQGAEVTGIDLASKALRVAQLHALEVGSRVDYREVAVEVLADESPARFDVVTCMEMLEHVPDPASVVTACARLAKPGGHVFLSTINRNLKSFALAIVGAEYLLGLLPRGTHEYARLLLPSELVGWARRAGLTLIELQGMQYNAVSRTATLGPDTDVNYLVACQRSA
jgi:2-polyprenyl-6-hydroxyphenyl methylase/3-demethylubiquinone-9 3-methyltransferase